MDEILVKLDAVIKDIESKSVLLGLQRVGEEPTELLAQLTEGGIRLRAARRCLARADYLMRKGYGKLVGPEE